MPANLTHSYLKAEQAYRRAATLDEELVCLQEMLREVPKHKGTDRLQADLKQKIRRAKQDLEQQRQRGVGKRVAARLARQGAGRVLLIGCPNVGKSQLLASLTSALPEIAPYPFTTREPLPGMMTWEDVTIQLVDTPPVTAEVFDVATLSLIRGADLVLLIVDLGADEGIRQFQELVAYLHSTKTRLASRSFLDESDVGVSYTRALVVLNKLDLPGAERRAELDDAALFGLPAHSISAQNRESLVELRRKICESLDIVRVYTKSPREKTPDYGTPYTIRRGQTLIEVAEQVHGDFARRLKYAKIWNERGQSGTTVKADYMPQDGDVIEFHV